ncbi:ABC transporter permease [Paludibacterium yongneupense]|uniref:ABC transporter permease n=1 Tax=Paludibacterium yongneupense TaxID=400061 RepID=UPI00040ADD8B|nr:FtsX-like permease family protein [Paludibacterium yongneupense]
MRARLGLILRFVRRELQSGELTVLALALVIAVTAMSSVAFFSDRVEQGLASQATQLLAADLVVVGDAPLAPQFARAASGAGLATASSVSFPSMIFADGQTALANLKAVSDSYPLRGEVWLRLADGRPSHGALHPLPGSVWADARLMQRLGVAPGTMLAIGSTRLRLTAEIVREPDGAMDLYNFIPRLVINQRDLAATGLIQEGSRARWRLMAAGRADAVASVRQAWSGYLQRGTRIEDVEEARPEVRTALTRARRFLGLTAMLTVALAAAAVSLAVRRYLARHWQAVAVLRCLGQTSSEVLALFASLFVLLGLGAGTVGTLLGFALQSALARMTLSWLGAALPDPRGLMFLPGPLAALVLLAGLALPPLLGLRQVPPLAVLRTEAPATGLGAATSIMAVFVLLGLAAWQVGDAGLALWMLAGFAGFFGGVALLALALVSLTRALSGRGRIGWRLGVISLARRPWLAVIQISALSVGLMALLTLTVVRNDLIRSWQQSIPADAPNHFVINLQPAQRAPFAAAFAGVGRIAPELAPMVRGRLTAINDHAVTAGDYRSGEARRLVEREFNLSWRSTLPPGNVLTAGRWWRDAHPAAQFSVEAGVAEKLGIRVGDALTFDIGGTPYEALVTSLRAVAWDSFRANFFVLAPPGLLSDQPSSWITSFHLAPGDEAFVASLVRRFPNITVIDVSEILDEVRAMIDRLSRAIEVMFALALAAGVLVLWAALATTRDERLIDVALLRAIGASRRQVRLVVVSELLWLGTFAGLLAGGGAMALGTLAASKLFNLPPTLDVALLPLGVGAGIGVVLLAGWPLVRRVTRHAPVEVLREL